MVVEAERAQIIIRDVEGATEMRAMEALQKEVWRLPDLDVVPLSQLVAVKEAGGVLLGAFDGATPVGFIYGFPSYEYGQFAHHSHMLAVKPAYRNHNLGYKLKLAQRERVLKQGIKFMSWTFDPLQSLNAHFNFAKLGVVADRYLINFYGEDATSFLHRNGTDRLWLTWPLLKEHKEQRCEPSDSELTPLVKVGLDYSPLCSTTTESLSGDEVLIEIPADINELQARSNNLAVVWRDITRWAFTRAIESGYLVCGFFRKSRGERPLGVYLLTRKHKLTDYL